MTEPQNNFSFSEIFDRGRVRFVSLVSFFLGFLDAFLVYLISSYFVQVTGQDQISRFYLVAFILNFLILIFLQRLISSVGVVRILLVSLTALIALSMFLSLGTPSWTGAIVLVIFIATTGTLWSVMDILLEDFSSDRMTGRVRGFYLTITNLGFLFAPFLAIRVLDTFGYEGIFTALIFGYSLVFFLLLTLRHHRTRLMPLLNFRDTLKRALENKNLPRIYAVSLALEFFYVIMVIYAPIYLLNQGFQWNEIGIIFTIMLTPFVLFQYPLGILADTRIGEKELLLIALLCLAIFTTVFATLHSHSLFPWAAVLFATRVGAAALEILRDSYFYKQIHSGDTDLVALFRTARPIANIVAVIAITIILLFFSLPSLFFLVATVAIGAFFLTLGLKDSTSEHEMIEKSLIKA